MRSYENQEYRKGDGVVLLRLLDRDDADATGLTFCPSARTYLANCKSVRAIVPPEKMRALGGDGAAAAQQRERFSLDGRYNRDIEQKISH